ncbi:MAG: hypothetical protein IJP29_00780 [Lachnospiraceae bacterium]|nr:hypothetical protein [Lachnospiraceae bacterium]
MSRFISRVAWVFIILGGVFLYDGVTSTINSKKTPVDFNSLQESQLESGMIVEGYIEYNYGYFEEEYRTTYGIKTGDSIYNYAIEIGKERYMGLKNQTEEQRIALDAQMNDTYTALSGYGVTPEKFYFKGQVKQMTSQEIGFLKDYLVSAGYTAEQAEKCICAYYIQCVDFDGGLLWAGIGALLLVAGLGSLIVPVIRERRENTRKQEMWNSVASQSSQASYNARPIDPFAPPVDEPASTSSADEVWNPAPTSSQKEEFSSTDNDSTSQSGSSTGLKLKM